MIQLHVDDIVVFNNPDSSLAASFCYYNKVAARIVGFDGDDIVVVDAGLGYDIYTKKNNVNVDLSLMPGLDGKEDIHHLIPQRCDDL